MMNLPSPAAAGLRLGFEKRRDSSSVSEQKKVGGFNYRGNQQYVHEEMINLQNWYMVEEKEDTGTLLCQKSCFELMQNCDLPPPVKVFAGAEKAAVTSFRTPSYTKTSGEDEFPVTRDSLEIEKLELLKALQLSQTRAREAERKATIMTQERDRLSNSVLKESLRLFSYRQWVKLLEIEVSQLQSHTQKEHEQGNFGCGRQLESEEGSPEEEKESNGGDIGRLRWSIALALCLGIASVGLCFGSRYFLF